MTIEECQNILNKISYKDGWKFEVFEAVGRPCLEITQPVLHRDTRKPITLKHHSMLGTWEMIEEDGLLRFVRSMIHEFERHEADEQFLYSEKRIFDPHVTPELP